MDLNDFGENQVFFDINNGDLISFHNHQNIIDDEIYVQVENDLKYSKYNYEYNMSNQNSHNSHYSQNTQNADNLNNIASIGMNLVGSFLDTATPIVKEFSNKMKEFEVKINEDEDLKKKIYQQQQGHQYNDTSKHLNTHRHEDNDNIYYVVELPRVKKEDCEVKYVKTENHLLISAKTELFTNEFSFLENKILEVKLPLPSHLNSVSNNITVKNRNGALYITICKNLINMNNININILD
jgi:HSP20 family molecular chaperone IbpA